MEEVFFNITKTSTVYGWNSSDGATLTMPNCVSDSTFKASIAFFAVGTALFLGTAIFWIIRFCKARHRKIKAVKRPLPLTPPTMTFEVQASGEYLDLQESIYNYESINVTPDVKETKPLHYIPRDAMHETFDGSRMPPTEAPKPPNHEPKIIDKDYDKRKELECIPDVKQKENLHDVPRDAMHETFDGSRMPTTEAPKPPNHEPKIIDKDYDKRKELECTPDVKQKENLHDVPRDAMHETFDGSRMPTTEAPKPPDQGQKKFEDHNKKKELECTYEMADASKPNRDKPPTIPARRPFRK